MYRLLIDIGHGNRTFEQTGGKGIWYTDKNGQLKKFEEHHFNSKVGILAKELAEYNGFEVIFSQEPFGDIDVPLITRTNLARDKKVDLLMSLHADANDNPSVDGHWVFYWYTDQKSKRLAQIWDKHANQIMGNRCRGVLESKIGTWTDFHMCREPVKYGIPAILCEHDFFTSPTGRERLMSEEFQNKCAETAIRSACEYFGIDFKSMDKKGDFMSVKVEKIRVASGSVNRIDGNYSVKGSDVRVIKINPEEYDIDFVVDRGKTVEQIAIANNADFAINAPFFYAGNIIGYSKNKNGIVSWDEPKTYAWRSFALKDGKPFIGAIFGADVVDFTFKGTPLLVEDGKNVANERVVVEGTAPDITTAPKPRTALFIDDKGDLIITIVDGWTKKDGYKWDQGLFLSELATLGINLGAVSGLNFDGGGSTTLWVKGQGVVNGLQDGASRAVGNAVIFKKKTITPSPQPKPEPPKETAPPSNDPWQVEVGYNAAKVLEEIGVVDSAEAWKDKMLDKADIWLVFELFRKYHQNVIDKK